jgi:hypothetical protein
MLQLITVTGRKQNVKNARAIDVGLVATLTHHVGRTYTKSPLFRE